MAVAGKSYERQLHKYYRSSIFRSQESTWPLAAGPPAVFVLGLGVNFLPSGSICFTYRRGQDTFLEPPFQMFRFCLTQKRRCASSNRGNVSHICKSISCRSSSCRTGELLYSVKISVVSVSEYQRCRPSSCSRCRSSSCRTEEQHSVGGHLSISVCYNRLTASTHSAVPITATMPQKA